MWNSSAWEKCSLLLYLFISSFICISRDLWIFILYFGLSSNTTLFWSSLCSSFGHWEPFLVGSVSIWNTLIILYLCPSTSFWYISHSSNRIGHFSKAAQFLLLDKVLGTKNWMLVVIIAAGIIASKPSQLIEQGNQKVYTSVYIWSRKWQPTPVSLPGESQGQRSLVGYSP